MTQNSTFEETYPRYPFSELVRLGIKLAEVLSRERKAPEPAGAETARS